MDIRLAFAAAFLLAPLGACSQIHRAQTEAATTAQQAPADPGLAGLDIDADGYLRLPSDDMWCEYRCANFPGRWRADAPTDVYAEPLAHAQALGRLSPGEIVNAVRYERRVKPRRGVVQRAGRGLEAGEVVYMIGGDETSVYLLRHGVNFNLEFDESDDDADQIAYDSEYESVDWVFVERDGGQPNGWLRNPQMPGMDSPLEE